MPSPKVSWQDDARCAKEIIAECVFGLKNHYDADADLDKYITYYIAEVERTYYHTQLGSHIAPYNRVALTDLILHLRNARDSDRKSIRMFLGSQSWTSTLSDTALDRFADLALRLVLALKIRKSQLQTPKTPVIRWEDDGPKLDEWINQQFPGASWTITTKDGRLDPFFTIANMIRICDLRIRWTDSLEDHLRLDRSRRELSIFHHETFLLGHIAGSNENGQPPMIPESVLTETLRSLDLLFPCWDKATERLLQKHAKTFHRSASYSLAARPLNLTQFDHWRDRILELYEEVYRSTPASWRQLWFDRRNTQQWWTFWLAAVILVLSLVSTVSTIVQAWASVKALNKS